MKKTLLIMIALVGILLPASVGAAESVEMGAPYKTWTFPVVYTPADEVTWYFDMTDTGFPDGVDLYMWSWAPSEPDAGNWENSSEFAKLEYIGDNVYKKTLIPTQYYNMSKEDIDAKSGDIYWMRLKTKDGSFQSGVVQMQTSFLEWSEFKASDEAVKAYPEKFSLKEPLSILIDIDKFVFGGKAGGLNDIQWESIHFHSGLDDWSVLQEAQMWLPESVEKTKIKQVEGSIYRMDLIPMEYYGVESDYEAENITWLITTHNPDWANTGDGPTLKAAAAIAYPDPQFSFFPQKFCALDMLTLTRKWNEKTAGELTYTITAGDKTITGVMAGNRDKREVTINLLQELAGLNNPSRIHLKIETANEVTVVDTNLPLVPLSEITYE